MSVMMLQPKKMGKIQKTASGGEKMDEYKIVSDMHS